jgi:hypothetical protein
MGKPDGDDSLSPDPLVKRLVPNPDEVPDLVSITGWLGKGSKKNVLRLYLTPNMGYYLEVDAGDVVHAEKIGKDSDLGGTVLWLQSDAKVRHHSTDSYRAEHAYLQGEIAGLSGPQAGSDPYPTTWTQRCRPANQFPRTFFSTLCNHPPTTLIGPRCW